MKHLDFEVLQEPWTVIKLADGTILKLRLIVSDVLQGEGTDPNGHPIINARSTNVVAVIWPDEADMQQLTTAPSSTRLN